MDSGIEDHSALTVGFELVRTIGVSQCVWKKTSYLREKLTLLGGTLREVIISVIDND